MFVPSSPLISRKKIIQIEKSCTRLFTIITDFKGIVLFLHVNKYSKIYSHEFLD